MFREKDLRGVTSDSAETLPANFRASAISTPSVTLRKVQSEGEEASMSSTAGLGGLAWRLLPVYTQAMCMKCLACLYVWW